MKKLIAAILILAFTGVMAFAEPLDINKDVMGWTTKQNDAIVIAAVVISICAFTIALVDLASHTSTVQYIVVPSNSGWHPPVRPIFQPF